MIKSISKKPVTLEAKVDRLSGTVDALAHTVDQLAIAIANGFSSLQTEINSIKTTMGGMATKADILALHDKFPSNQKFDALTVRVSKLEAKSKR